MLHVCHAGWGQVTRANNFFIAQKHGRQDGERQLPAQQQLTSCCISVHVVTPPLPTDSSRSYLYEKRLSSACLKQQALGLVDSHLPHIIGNFNLKHSVEAQLEMVSCSSNICRSWFAGADSIQLATRDACACATAGGELTL
jgi:hypothetical protein